MQSMAHERSLQFRSFWQLQMAGWTCFYVWGLLGSLPDLLGRPGALRQNTISTAFMFLGSCALWPICRELVRRRLALLAYEWRVAVFSIVAANLCALAAGITLGGIRSLEWSDLAP